MKSSLTATQADRMPRIVAGLLALVVLAGCGGSSSSSGRAPISTEGVTAVIATISPDYTSGQVELVSLEAEPMQASGGLHETVSDIAVRSHGQHFYLLERFGSDHVSKFDITNPGVYEWQHHGYRTQDTSSPNLQDLVFVNDEKAYLLRYDAGTAWIVNPSAVDPADFFLGELDLSAYTAGSGTPNMAAGIIIGGQLFIALQRLDAYWTPSNTGYIAVFDTSTDAEIETGHNKGGLKGIPLISHNPMSMSYQPDLGLLVHSVGEWYGWSIPGGIDLVDLGTFAVAQILQGDQQLGRIDQLAVIDSSHAYISASKTFGKASVFRINPSTGEVLHELPAASDRDIRALAIDPLNRLWIADAGDSSPNDPPGIQVIDPSNDSSLAFIQTELLPIDITFVTE